MSSPPNSALTCRYCGEPTRGRITDVRCSAAECKKQYQRDRCREQQRGYRAEYAARGESWAARWRSPEQEQADFARLAERRKKGDFDDTRKDGWQRRRAQKLEAPVERFRHEEIYRRDGWVCQLCKKKVDKKLKYPDDMSASLDHKKPLSRGGHHTRANVQLAHLTCNLAKGARYG